jgi:hypothetical protein
VSFWRWSRAGRVLVSAWSGAGLGLVGCLVKTAPDPPEDLTRGQAGAVVPGQALRAACQTAGVKGRRNRDALALRRLVKAGRGRPPPKISAAPLLRSPVLNPARLGSLAALPLLPLLPPFVGSNLSISPSGPSGRSGPLLGRSLLSPLLGSLHREASRLGHPPQTSRARGRGPALFAVFI